MPAWMDMRETRRVREHVVASTNLPYWNAEGSTGQRGGNETGVSTKFHGSDFG